MARGKKKYDPNVPEVLRTPIEHNNTMHLIALGTKADDEVAMEARREIWVQLMERYRALFEVYGLSPSDPNAKDLLILMMASKLFPDGFRRTVKGRKTGVKMTCWTVGARLELLDTVWMLRSGGMSIDEAERMTINDAAQYLAAFNLLPSGVSANQHPDCIKTRYHETKKLMERIAAKALTPAEELELLAFVEGVKIPATDESESTD
jgi:hypothetical protein